ncbi:MAG: ATP-binding protein [Parabacteroides merdae]
MTAYSDTTIFCRSNGLVRSIESYRKITGIPIPVLEIISVNYFLNDICLLFKNLEDKIKIIPTTAHLQVIADKGLIENALDATRHCSRPRIELSAGINEEGKTFIRASDNGTGIQVEVQERIFILFFTTKPSSSGIGLSISRQIMHMHKGYLSVLSEDGQGSRLFVTFGSIQK